MTSARSAGPDAGSASRAGERPSLAVLELARAREGADAVRVTEGFASVHGAAMPAGVRVHPLPESLRPPFPKWVFATAQEATEEVWPVFHSAAGEGSPGLVAADLPDGTGASWVDFALYGSIARARVVAPPDAPTARRAFGALERVPGPSYLRLPAEPVAPGPGDPSFGLGEVRELQAGTELTLIGVGRALTAARLAAEEVGRIGTSVRLLDGACVKPGASRAVLAAARETQGIVVVEEHTARTGYGAWVAATVAESVPVPVRRVGIPDLAPAGGRSPAALGVTPERVVEEAWALLRARGKL